MRALPEPVLDELRKLLGPRRAPGLGPDFAGVLQDLLRQARRELPTVPMPARSLALRIYEALESHDVSSWAGMLSERHGVDLCLCAALLNNDPEAVKVFETALNDAVGRVQRKFKLSEDERQETTQKVRIRLLLGVDGAPARIARYHGQASLRGWIRTAAGRLVINDMKAEERHRQRSAIPDAGIPLTADTLALKQEQRALFGHVLREAFETLEPRQRTLLRLRYVEGMQASDLATLYAVHESTMSRWLAAAREGLSTAFEQRLVARRSYGVQSLVGALASGFDQSLAGLFATSDGSGGPP